MQPPDPLDRLRDAAVGAVARYIDMEASGLMSVLRRSVDYAVLDASRKQIVIDRRAILLAMLEIGVHPSYQYDNSANWLADWLQHRLPDRDFATNTDKSKTDQTQLVDAFEAGFAISPSDSLGRAFDDAVKLTRSTRNRDKVALRHLLVAVIEQPEHQLEMKDLGWKAASADVTALRAALFAHIARNPERGEAMDAWREILGQPGAEEGGATEPTAPPAIPTDFVSGFSADRTRDHDSDPLETEADVLAMARLICHEDADPPISIGVFGGWGSGKSTFMEALQWEVANLADPDKRPDRPDEGPRFVSPVVQIRFNAWQFADADLWASLTAEFFDQLRAGGFEGGGKRIHAELVEEVNEHVRGLSHEAAGQRAALASADEKVREAQSAHAKAVKLQPMDVEQALVSGLAEALERNRADLTRYGIIDSRSADNLSEFIALAREARTEWGRVKRIPGMLRGQWPLLAGVLLVGAIVATGAYLLLANKAVAAALAGLLTVAVGLLPVIRRGLSLIDTVVKQIGPFAEKLRNADAEGLKRVLATEVALRSAASEAEALRASAERAERALARYVDPSAKANPPRVLRYLLEDDPDTRAFEKEMGLIGRARRLFQALDEIVGDNRKKRERLRTLLLQGDLGEGEADALERDRLALEVDDQIPDRIILYIDDLDRCTHEQVYNVLQAIHLLLAFELFVVVVAVDVAWIEAALAKSIEFAGVDSEEKEAKDAARRQRAIEYLSKIFQLPFWLKPFGGKDDSRYASYVRTLTRAGAGSKPDAEVDEHPKQEEITGRTPTPPLSHLQESRGDTQREAEKAGESGERNGTEARQGGTPDEPAVTRAPDEVARALRTLQLTVEEEDFLASSEIAALAAPDPRGVKRLVNVYKIVRSRLSEQDEGSILGGGGRPPIFPIIALCAAIETGQAIDSADSFYRSLKIKSEGGHLGGYASDSALGAAIAAAVAKRGGAPISSDEALTVGGVVRRYSFNRYH